MRGSIVPHEGPITGFVRTTATGGAVVLILAVMILAASAGCTTQEQKPNRYITVTNPDGGSPVPVNAGSLDMNTLTFRIGNPTNRTFTNVRIAIAIEPVQPDCHSLEKTFEIAVLPPQSRTMELVSLAEFSGADCQYTYTSSVVSDP